MKNSNSIAHITFIGSGISTSFTLLKLFNLIENDAHFNHKLIINVIDKSSEFNTGIPYGNRSGFSTLLITSLRNFLPEPELSEFILWLNNNKNYLLSAFKKEGGKLSQKWLEDHKEQIDNNAWEDLFIPRRFFGSYIDEKVKNAIQSLENKKKIELNFLKGEAIDILKENHIYNISLDSGLKIRTNKMVLSVGSLPVKNLWGTDDFIEKDNFMLVNTPYDPELNSTLKKIKTHLDKAKNRDKNVLIVGANASALEILYKLNDTNTNDISLNKFVFLSTQGKAPDAKINEKGKEEFIPINLYKLKSKQVLTAKAIAEATFKDIKRSEEINLGAASTVETISAAFGNLLANLDKRELEKFACLYGNEIGKKQRCAGLHYSNTIDDLVQKNKFEHVAGRFHNLLLDENNDYFLEYLDTETNKVKKYETPFHLVINCIGGMKLTQDCTPKLIQNLINKGYATPNDSEIGFRVNKSLETIDNFHVMGPLLAGNVINNNAVWHVEHCGRIIWISEILSEIIYKDISSKKLNAIEQKTDKNNATFVELTNKKDWDDTIKDIKNYDFYHTYDYHALSAQENETPVLLKYAEGDFIVAFPLILRSIPGTKYKDATSVYGYVGPVFKGNPNFDNSNFIKVFTKYFNDNNIISVFSRLNPYITDQNNILEGFGKLILQGKIVNIDLDLSLDEQKSNYRKRLKTYINKARKECSIKTSNSIEDLHKFIDLYYENMNRVNAKKFYYFNKSYFENIIKSKEFETTILLVSPNNSEEVIGASMFIASNEIVHYHLSGTSEKFVQLNPTKLLIDEMRIMATKKGYNSFNLGGGLGGADNDSLFHFKSSFSKDFRDFKLWTFIANEKVYNELVLKKGMTKEPNYFPLYRYVDDLNVNLCDS
ncbi:peptidoglycan bridge formation glycyltransferase FemA/FemB family protein [Mariniflexile sp. HMF6888]|uniref:peptidoglycan bridge formation glycyltransferase FemA/FemB family protein n=1 Tax=Mariniflexile sp. HMF6888 TaxID=3373086 RepID=UPI0037909AF6